MHVIIDNYTTRDNWHPTGPWSDKEKATGKLLSIKSHRPIL